MANAINKALAMDIHTRNKLLAHHGASIDLCITDWDIVLRCVIQSTAIDIQLPTDAPPTAALKGKLFDLLRTGVADDKHSAMRAANIRFEGDIGLAQDLQLALSEMDLDWAGELAKLTGNPIAHTLETGAKKLKAHLVTAKTQLKQASIEYAHFEAKLMPTKEQVTEFYDGVRIIRDDVERLEARISALTTKAKREKA